MYLNSNTVSLSDCTSLITFINNAFYLPFLFRFYCEIYSESPIAYQFSKILILILIFHFYQCFGLFIEIFSDLSENLLYKHSCYFATIYSAKYFCL